MWGTNTGTGKTLVSAALARAALRRSIPSLYCKPVQTGYADGDDDGKTVARLAGGVHWRGEHASALHAELVNGTDAQEGVTPLVSGDAQSSRTLSCCTLFAWSAPVSPHLAVQNEGRAVDGPALIEAVLTPRSAEQYRTDAGARGQGAL